MVEDSTILLLYINEPLLWLNQWLMVCLWSNYWCMIGLMMVNWCVSSPLSSLWTCRVGSWFTIVASGDPYEMHGDWQPLTTILSWMVGVCWRNPTKCAGESHPIHGYTLMESYSEVDLSLSSGWWLQAIPKSLSNQLCHMRKKNKNCLKPPTSHGLRVLIMGLCAPETGLRKVELDQALRPGEIHQCITLFGLSRRVSHGDWFLASAHVTIWEVSQVTPAARSPYWWSAKNCWWVSPRLIAIDIGLSAWSSHIYFTHGRFDHACVNGL